MKVLTGQPLNAFTTGDVLDPNTVHLNYEYLEDTIDDVLSKRYTHFHVVIPLQRDCATGYANTDNIETRTYSFTPPNTCILERAFLTGTLGALSGQMDINLTTSAGATPSGVSNPILRATSTTASDVYAFPFIFTAGTEYDFRIEPNGAGTFTTAGLFLVLHCKTDRWVTAGSETAHSFSAPNPTDASARNATTISTANTSLSTAAALGASNYSAPSAVLFVIHDFTSTTNASARRFPLPLWCSSESSVKALKMYAWGYCSSVGPTVTWTVADAANATLTSPTASVALNMSAASTASGSTTLGHSLTNASSTITQTPASDYSVFVSSNSATTCNKSYCWLWLDRSA